MARIQGSIRRLNDVIGSYLEEIQPIPLCRRYENLFGRILELSHTLELLTPEMQALSSEVSFLQDIGCVYPCM